MNNMMTRALSGAVYVALLVFTLMFAPSAGFAVLMIIFAMIGIGELQAMRAVEAPMSKAVRFLDLLMPLAVIGGGIMCTVPGMKHDWLVVLIYILAAYGALYFTIRMVLAIHDRNEKPVQNYLTSALSLFYIVLPLSALAFLAYCDARFVLLTFIMIWLNDTGAYLTGRQFGRHKLCERLSPKKTWEGFWGGFAFSVVAGAVAAMFVFPVNPLLLAAYGALVSVLSTYGDLFESLLKRTAGVKDSGNLIPGHGGILDRIDSVLAVAIPALIFYSIFQ